MGKKNGKYGKKEWIAILNARCETALERVEVERKKATLAAEATARLRDSIRVTAEKAGFVVFDKEAVRITLAKRVLLSGEPARIHLNISTWVTREEYDRICEDENKDGRP